MAPQNYLYASTGKNMKLGQKLYYKESRLEGKLHKLISKMFI